MLPFLDIYLSVLLRFTHSDNPFGILKLFVIDYPASTYIVTVVMQGSNINYGTIWTNGPHILLPLKKGGFGIYQHGSSEFNVPCDGHQNIEPT
jgi:hypothetical protein